MIEKNTELLWALADGGRDRQINSAQGIWHSLILKTCLFYLTTFPLSNVKTYLHLIKGKPDEKVKQILL